VTVSNTRPEHVRALAALQRIVFPTLTENELLTESKYLKHLELFPAGQFVALVRHNGRQIPVGATSTFRTRFDFSHIQHKFLEAVADGWLTNHDPEGEWLYGADLSVHPEFRGRRIGRRLYEARRQLVRRLNLRGEIAGALLPGYIHHHRRLTVAQYVLRVWQGHIFDPTLSMQIRNGFAIKGILYDHIHDPRSNNTATLIVRQNPHYQPMTAVAGAGYG
jgi:GNAT superfamily N-acetyltransferase